MARCTRPDGMDHRAVCARSEEFEYRTTLLRRRPRRNPNGALANTEVVRRFVKGLTWTSKGHGSRAPLVEWRDHHDDSGEFRRRRADPASTLVHHHKRLGKGGIPIGVGVYLFAKNWSQADPEYMFMIGFPGHPDYLRKVQTPTDPGVQLI